MSTQAFHFYKGDTTFTDYPFDPDMKLDKVRKSLVSRGFMTQDESTNHFRFINFQNTGLSYEDMVMGISSEKWPPLSSVMGKGNQIYLTDVAKKKEVDLIGFNTNWFFDRFMGIRVTLNGEDNAAAANAGKFQPLMLTNVKVANPNIRGVGAIEKAIICEKDSLISFGITSWCSAGYGYQIKPEAGTPINDNLYMTTTDCSRNYIQGGLSRYYSSDKSINGSMIKVVPTASMNVGGKTLQYMKFTATTWVVNSYKQGGKTHSCNKAMPTSGGTARTRSLGIQALGAGGAGGGHYNEMVGAQTVVPGSTIQPGSTVPDDKKSSQTIGSISDIDSNSGPTGIIGSVVFYLFVFNSHEDAKKVFAGVNDLDPSVWSK